MYATNYFETAILNVMKGITLTAPSKVYVGLYISNPTETGAAGTEVSYSGYTRKQITFSEPAPESGGIGIKNDGQITFPTSLINAGTVTYIGIHDSLVAGNMLAYGKLTEELVIGENEAPVLLPQEIVYYLTGNMSTSFKTKVLNVLRGQSISGVSPYFALFNGNPDSGGAELSGDNYARVALTFSNPSEAESGQMEIMNTNASNFNRPTTDWGTWNYSAIYSQASNGEALWVAQRNPAKEIKKGYMPTIAESAIKLAIN